IVTSPLTIRGAGAATTIIERPARAPAFGLLNVAAAGNLTLQRLTMRGGAIGGLSNFGTMNIRQCTIALNDGLHDRAWSLNFWGEVTIDQSAIIDNTNIDSEGGGILTVGGVVIVHNSTLAGNIVSGSNIGANGSGGAISGSGVSITNSTLAENAACGVGGIA